MLSYSAQGQTSWYAFHRLSNGEPVNVCKVADLISKTFQTQCTCFLRNILLHHPFIFLTILKAFSYIEVIDYVCRYLGIHSGTGCHDRF